MDKLFPDPLLPPDDETLVRHGRWALVLTAAAFVWPILWVLALAKLWPVLREGRWPWLLAAGAVAQALGLCGWGHWLARRKGQELYRACTRAGLRLIGTWLACWCAAAQIANIFFR